MGVRNPGVRGLVVPAVVVPPVVVTAVVVRAVVVGMALGGSGKVHDVFPDIGTRVRREPLAENAFSEVGPLS